MQLKFCSIIVLFSFTVSTVVSHKTYANDTKRFGYDIRIRANMRIIEDRESNETAEFSQTRIETSYTFGEKRCVTLSTRIASGETYNQEQEDLHLGKDYSVNIHLRHFFVNLNCIDEKISMQIGALPNYNDFAPNGWFDGLRIFYDATEKRTWSFSVGEIDEFDTPYVFNRNFSKPNVYKIEVEQELGHGFFVSVGVTQFEDENQTSWIIEKVMKDHRIFDRFQLEQVRIDSDLASTVAEAEFKPFKKWSISVAASVLDRAYEQDFRRVRYFFGAGTNYQLQAERRIANRTYLRLRTRNGDGKSFDEIGFYKQFRN